MVWIFLRAFQTNKFIPDITMSLTELGRVLYNMPVKMKWYVKLRFLSFVRHEGWIHYGRSVLLVSCSFIERIRIAVLVISFSSYLDALHPNDVLRPASTCSRSAGSQPHSGRRRKHQTGVGGYPLNLHETSETYSISRLQPL
jgi:hypothetical protein